MSKLIDDESGVWRKTIINSEENLEGSGKAIKLASNELKRFDEEKKAITSMVLTVNYCNTTDSNNDPLVDQSISGDSQSTCNSRADDLKGLLVWEESTIGDIRYKDSELTMRDKLISYMDTIVSRGMMNEHQYARFVNTIMSAYKILTSRENIPNNISVILDNMNLGYYVTHYPATIACPNDFFKLSRINEIRNEDYIVDDNIAEKIDEFMQQWFDHGNGKIYDKDRDEFYTDFISLYESLTEPNNEEKGVITVTRRTKPKKVMGMKPIINYSEINKILKACGLNYHISYQQETIKSEELPKRRNSLSLRQDR